MMMKSVSWTSKRLRIFSADNNVKRTISPALYFCAFISLITAHPLPGQPWVPSGPAGAEVTCLHQAKWDPDILFLGTFETGIWRCDLRTRRWQSVSESLPWFQTVTGVPQVGLYHEIVCFETSSLIDGTVWVSLRNRGIWKSVDEGETWFQDEESWDYYLQIKAHPTDTSLLYAFPDPTYHPSINAEISQDGGNTWRELDNLPAGAIAFNPATPQTLIIGKKISRDNGQTFSDLGPFPTVPDGIVFQIEFDPSNPSRCLAIVALPWTIGRLMRSSNQGDDWEELRTISQEEWPYILRFREDGSVFVADNRIAHSALYSDDRGDTWIELDWTGDGYSIGYRGTIDAILPLALPSSSVLFGTPGSIYRSEDNGRTVQLFDDELYAGKIKRLDTDEANNLYAVGWQGFYRSSTDGQSWERLGDWITPIFCIDGTNGEINYVYNWPHNDSAGIYKTINGGHQWSRVFTFPPGLYVQGSHLASQRGTIGTILLSVDKPDSLRVYRTIDGGESWTQTLSAPSIDSRRECRIIQDRTNPSRVIIGGTQAHLSEDFGESWRLIETPAYVNSVLLGFNDAEATLVAQLDYRIYKSTDLGETWSYFGEGLNSLAGTTVNLKFVQGTNYIVLVNGYNDPLYYRELNAPVWTELTGNPDYAHFTDVISASNGRLIVASRSRSNYLVDTLTDVAVEIDPVQPASPALSLNLYPNPFNTMITIDARSAFGGPVQFSIYNQLGQKMISDVIVSADRKFHWSPQTHGSGVFFVCFKSNSIQETRRITYIK